MKLTINHINSFLLTIQPGGIFHRDDILKHFSIEQFENKDYLRKALFDKVAGGEIVREGKRDGLFRRIDSELPEMNWWNANPEATFPLIFPYGIEDNTQFGLDCIQLYPKDIVVIAGVSNMGKTTFALNILVNNMDIYTSIYYTNEFSPPKLKARLQHFDWVNLLNGNGTPKFKVIERYDNFEDVINPDALNIIDWIELTGESGQEFYRIGGILKHIQEKLNKGICVAVLQKKQHPNVKMGQQDLGVGGEASLRRAALYINIDYQKLTVKKCKSWKDTNPNGRSWRFDIIEHGSRFHRIELLEESTGKPITL